MRFNEGRGYFFIYDLEGTNIFHAVHPEREGLNFFNAKDTDGVFIVQNSINIAKSVDAEGFHNWMFKKPNNTSQEFKKIGFIKKFEPYNWFIGTGEYIIDYENNLKKTILEHLKNLKYKNNGHIFVINSDGKMLLTKTTHTNVNEIYKSNVLIEKFSHFVHSKKDDTYIKFKFKSDEVEYEKISY
jgi:signal transduction histidine kinase